MFPGVCCQMIRAFVVTGRFRPGLLLMMCSVRLAALERFSADSLCLFAPCAGSLYQLLAAYLFHHGHLCVPQFDCETFVVFL